MKEGYQAEWTNSVQLAFMAAVVETRDYRSIAGETESCLRPR